MVLLCRGLSLETLGPSALNRDVTEEALALKLDSPIDLEKSNVQAQKKATSNKRADQLVTFILIIHGYSFINGVELFVKQIKGVKGVRSDSNSIKLEVTGVVDPFEIRELVEKKTKTRVELIIPSPLNQKETKRDENQIFKEKLKNLKKKAHGNDLGHKKTEQRRYVLKIKLCCDSCNQKLKKILKIKGLETLTMDVEKDLITVEGTADMAEVESYIKDVLKKDALIIFPAEVLIPTKKDDGAAYKKENDAGITVKKDRDDEATNKKKVRNDATLDKNCRNNAMVYEKNEGLGTVDEKTKSITEVDVQDKAVENINLKLTSRENDKDYVVNDEKNKRGDINSKGRNKVDDGGGAMKKVNAKIYPSSDERKVYRKICYHYDYDYPPFKYSNGIDLIFSDENPNSCCIM